MKCSHPDGCDNEPVVALVHFPKLKLAVYTCEEHKTYTYKMFLESREVADKALVKLGLGPLPDDEGPQWAELVEYVDG